MNDVDPIGPAEQQPGEFAAPQFYPDPKALPTLVEVAESVASMASMLQFKNSLKFIQTQTNVSLDRMIGQLDVLGSDCYLEGIKKGLAIGKAIGMEEFENARPSRPADKPATATATNRPSFNPIK